MINNCVSSNLPQCKHCMGEKNAIECYLTIALSFLELYNFHIEHYCDQYFIMTNREYARKAIQIAKPKILDRFDKIMLLK